ncbi:MAG: autotransporter-associated beta strand repeat-containing protein [Planctomycetia bacterium]|nr:autotransporter-associated beta strand repeat-containing protein [Planctomycetia bacterium]
MTINAGNSPTITTDPAWSGAVIFDGGTLTAQTNDITLGNAIQVNDTNGTIDTATLGKTLTLSGNLTAASENSTLTKTGAGTLKITSKSQFLGTLAVTGGVLEMASNRGANTNADPPTQQIRFVEVTNAELLLSAKNAFGAGTNLPEMITLTNSTMNNTVGGNDRWVNIGHTTLNNSTITSSSNQTYNWAGKIIATGNSSIENCLINFRTDGHSLTGVGTIDVATGNDFLNIASTLSFHNAGITLTKTGGGTVLFTGSLGGNNAFQLDIQGGSFQMGDGGTSGQIASDKLTQITLSGGSFIYNRSGDYTHNNIVVTKGGTISSMGTGRLTAYAKATASDQVTLIGMMDITIDTTESALELAILGFGEGDKNIVHTGGVRDKFLNLTTDTSGFAGTFTVKGNVWTAFSSGTSLGSAKAHWILDCGLDAGLLVNSSALAGQTIELGNLTGNGIVRTAHTGMTTIQVGALLEEGKSSVFDGALSGFNNGTLALEKVGKGTWILTNAGVWQNTYAVHENVNNYTGDTTITEGTLQIGNGGTTGALPAASKIVLKSAGTLAYNRSDAVSLSNVIELNGGRIANNGAEKLTLSAQAITSDTVTLAGTGAMDITLDTSKSGLNLANEGTSVKNITHTGTVRGNFLHLLGDISNLTGTVTVEKDNWVAFTNSNTYGTNTGSANVHWILDTNTDSGLLINNANQTIKLGNLTGNGWVRSHHDSCHTTLQVGALLGEGESSVFDGALNSNGADMALEKVGAGTWILTNAGTLTKGDSPLTNVHSYSDSTTIKEGAIRLGNGGTTGALPTASKIVIEADGGLEYNRSDNIQVANAIEINGGYIANLSQTGTVTFTTAFTGTGFTKTGAGTIIVTKHCFSDGNAETVVAEGTLQVGTGGTSLDGTDVNAPKVSGNITIKEGATFHVNRTGETTYSGNISGAGTFLKTGNALMKLQGNNLAFTGDWILRGGNTTLSSDNGLGIGSTLTLDGATVTTSMVGNLNNDIYVTDNGGVWNVNSTLQENGTTWNTKVLYVTGNLTGTGKLTVSANQRGNFFHLQKLKTSAFQGTLETIGNTWILLNGDKSNSQTTFLTNNTTDSGFLIQSKGDYQFGDIQGNGGWVRTDQEVGIVNITVGDLGTTSDYHSTFSGSFRILYDDLAATQITVTKVGEGKWTLGSSVDGYRANDANQASFVVQSGMLELARDAGIASAIDLTVDNSGILLLSTPNQTITGKLASTGRILADLEILDNIRGTDSSLLTINSLDGSTSLTDSIAFLFDGTMTPTTAFDVDPTQIVAGATDWEWPDMVTIYDALMTDISAYWLVSANGDGSYHFAVNSAMVPEPSSIVLLLLGFLALGYARFSRKRKG